MSALDYPAIHRAKSGEYREPLMTAADLSRLTGIRKQTISDKLKKSGLEFKQISSKKYYKKSQIMDWYKESFK